MSGSHLSKEFFDLVKQIGESRSKQEEDKIIVHEVHTLKQKMVRRDRTQPGETNTRTVGRTARAHVRG